MCATRAGKKRGQRSEKPGNEIGRTKRTRARKKKRLKRRRRQRTDVDEVQKKAADEQTCPPDRKAFDDTYRSGLPLPGTTVTVDGHTCAGK